MNSFPPEPAISAVDRTLPDLPCVRKPPGNPAAMRGAHFQMQQPPTPPLWGGGRAEKRNQQEPRDQPSCSFRKSWPSACVTLSICPVERRTPAPPSTPAGSTKVLNCDMNRSLASYRAPGPHTLNLDMPVTGAYSGFPQSPSINSFHIISHSLVPWSKDAHWGKESLAALCEWRALERTVAAEWL